MRSEIVDLCCHREVLTGNRCNLLVVDRLKHRFFPTRATRSEDVRSAIEEMYRILDAPGSDAGMRPSRGRWGGYFFWTQVPSGSWIQLPGCAFSRSVSA